MHCNPPAPEELLDMFKENMSDDLKLRYEIKVDEDAWNLVYAIIIRKLINKGKNMELDFMTMPKINLEKIAKQKEKMDQSAHLKFVEKMELQMNDAQKEIFLKVKDFLSNVNGTDKKCFFIDGPGGTGKTFVYKAIYHLAISMNKKIENTAFSGIAATKLPKGKTNYNLFKLLVPINQDSDSRIELNSVEGKRLRDCDIIVWDEAPMAPKYALEICNIILQQQKENTEPFGGKIILLGDDFREVLPVKERSVHPTEVIGISIKASSLWKKFQVFKLTENMRANPNAKRFAQEILEIGDGVKNNESEMVEPPQEYIVKSELHESVFDECLKKLNWKKMSDRAILAAKNSDVFAHKDMVLSMLRGEERVYTSVDEAAN